MTPTVWSATYRRKVKGNGRVHEVLVGERRLSRDQARFVRWFHTTDWSRFQRIDQRKLYVQFCRIHGDNPLPPLEDRLCRLHATSD